MCDTESGNWSLLPRLPLSVIRGSGFGGFGPRYRKGPNQGNLASGKSTVSIRFDFFEATPAEDRNPNQFVLKGKISL